MTTKTKQATTPKTKPTVEVGGEVQASCRKCKGATTHLVVAKIGWKPTRVKCCVCSAVHDFRVARPAARKTTTVEQLAEKDPGELWRLAMNRAKGPTRPYDRREGYVVGNRLSHDHFGEGVVIRCSSGTVCEVAFETRTAKLVMATARSRAAQPSRS